MKQELVQLAKDKGFVATFVYDKPFIYSSKEPLRWLFWMTELQKWLREFHRIHIVVDLWIDMDRRYHYNYTLSQEYYPGTTDKDFIPFIEYVEKTGRICDWRINHTIKENVYSWETYEGALETVLFEALKLIEV